VRKLDLSAASLATLIGLLACDGGKSPSNDGVMAGNSTTPSGSTDATMTGSQTGSPPGTQPSGTATATVTGTDNAPPGTASGGPTSTGTTEPTSDPSTDDTTSPTDTSQPTTSQGPTSSSPSSSTPSEGTGGDPTGGTGDDDGAGGVPTVNDGGAEPTAGDASPAAPGCEAPTEYPNLFVTVGGHTQEESDAKVAAAWNQLFNPSNNNTVYYDGPGADESYVQDTGNNDVRTEGMSYGMMTAVQLGKQTEFDRLWNWVKNHMAQGTTGEIAWKCSTNGSKQATGGAPDGEEYMATALIFAHNRWGSTGAIDYATEAQWVLDLIRTKYFNEEHHIVKFVSGSNNTDGSYVLPSFYQTWACFDTANAEFWNAAVTAGREFFHAAADSNGVIPDQSSFTGQAQGGAGSDAKRCVMNIMMDANFFGVDPWQTETYAPAFGTYMSSHGDNTAAQFSCNALLGFGLPESSGKPFVDKIWSAQIPTGQWRYYDGTLYMLALLHVSGTFKLYY
jgi:oligosaccharide reducing-end xylanase